MKVSIAPLQPADMPARHKAFWRLTGPGAVLVGLSIGAGEIVVWPRIAAEYGASMIWAAGVGVFLQLWINIEVGRWTVATGESSYTGFARLWKGYALAFIFFNLAGWILPGWARTSGLALKALTLGPTHASPDWLWTAVTFAGVIAVLLGPRRVYVAVERTVSALVIIVVIGLLLIAFRVGTLGHVGEMLRGIINVGHVEPGFSVRELFIAVVFAGAGGTANLFYAFYLRDKRVGMGARVPMLINPLRGREEAVQQTGYVYPETDANQHRFRDWLRFVFFDQTLYFFLLNSFTMFLFIFGAVAVLHPQGVVPQAGSLMWDEATILAESMGWLGRYLFLLVAVATLFSTQVTLTDGVARSLSDIFNTSFAFARRAGQAAWYVGMVVFIVIAGTVLTAIMEYRGITELGFLFNAAYMGGFAMALYTPLLLWMNLRHLPKSARPGPLNVTMMLLASLVYLGFALFSLAAEAGIIAA
jgi:hypothetical protein